jgi:transcriptional regulator with XRE-family HTH domain
MTMIPPAGAPDAAGQLFLRALGKRVRIARVTAEWSQAELAVRAGMSRNFISSIERGAHGVDVLRLLRLADALHVALTDLLPVTGRQREAEQESSEPARRSA